MNKVLRKQRQEDFKSQVGLSYKVRPCLTKLDKYVICPLTREQRKCEHRQTKETEAGMVVHTYQPRGMGHG